jgi:hypothetical protein
MPIMDIINFRKKRKVFHLSIGWYGGFTIRRAILTNRQWHIATPFSFLTIGF